MEAIRFLADLTKETPANTYPGWPLTISQFDNDGRRAIGYLPRLMLSKPNQLIKIINERTQEIVKIIRVKGNKFVPSVFENGNYTIEVGEGAERKTIKNVEISSEPNKEIAI
ncbi:MAG: hypothetical protein R2822_27625 [Spirosomataceae bacterium]